MLNFSLPGVNQLLEFLFLTGIFAFILYYIFGKNQIALTGRRLVRIYLYMMIFLGIVMASSGLNSFFSGSIGLLSPSNVTTTVSGRPGMTPRQMNPDQIQRFQQNQSTENQRVIVLGISEFLLGVFATMLHLIVVNIVEQRNPKSLLRTLTGGAGIFIFGVLLVYSLVGFANGLANSAVSQVLSFDLRDSLGLFIAVIPTWFIFFSLTWSSIKSDFRPAKQESRPMKATAGRKKR